MKITRAHLLGVTVFAEKASFLPGTNVGINYICETTRPLFVHSTNLNPSQRHHQATAAKDKLKPPPGAVVQYTDRGKLQLPTHCPVKSLLHQVTEILFQTRPSSMDTAWASYPPHPALW